MAKNDISFFRPPPGRNPHVANYGVTASETFEEGEVVVVSAAGLVSEAGDDPATVSGISAGTSQGRTTQGGLGSPGSLPAGSPVLVYGTNGNIFRTENFATDGAGTAATPTLANVGDLAGFTLASGTWSVDTGATNQHVEIVDVLDVNLQSLSDTSKRTAGTGVYTVFTFLL